MSFYGNNTLISGWRLWTPASLGGNLLGWWDASRAETITLVSNAVSQWSDLSGKGNHLVQATASKRPAYGSFAGRPSVILDGTDDTLLTSLVTPPNVAIFSVYGYPNNNSSPPFVWSRNDGNTSSAVQELHLSSNGTIRAINRNTGPYADTPTGTPQSFYDDCTLGGAYGELNNDVLRAHLNGLAVQSATVREVTNVTSELCFGMRDNSVLPSASRYTEIVMFTNWTLPDIWKVEGYLAHRWGGLPLSRLITNHPFRNRPPLIRD